jgi:hypothetical protein
MDRQHFDGDLAPGPNFCFDADPDQHMREKIIFALVLTYFFLFKENLSTWIRIRIQRR